MQKVYISCPVALDARVLLGIAEKLHVVGKFDVKYWTRGYYDPTLLDDADIFVFLTPGNQFNIDKKTLPTGVRRELDTAIRQGKHIYMTYKNIDGEYNFYNVAFVDGLIKGLPGTTANIFKKNIVEDIKPMSKQDYDTWGSNDKTTSKQDIWSKALDISKDNTRSIKDRRLLLCVKF